MKPPRPWTLCHRDACRQPFHLHKDGACLDGRGSFVRHPPDSVKRASFSLSEDEIKALDIVTRGLINGRELTQIAKGLRPHLVGVLRKVSKARETIEENKKRSASVATQSDSHKPNGVDAGAEVSES